VEPGSVFNFKVEVMNPTNYVLGYILSVMDQIQRGNVQVGGNKSRGFGVVKFKDVKLKMESYANYELPEMDPIDEIVNLQYPVDISIGEQNDAFKRLVDVFNSFMTKGVKK
jgi:CRISPR/Cas system CSM-associated protein Csm3 (group 7 of RAMP superfamily)